MYNIFDAFPTVERPDGHLLPVGVKTQDAAVVGKAAPNVELVGRVGIGLVGVSDFSERSNGHLRSQIKPLSHVVVDGLLELVL
jgi:hypothetical protein